MPKDSTIKVELNIVTNLSFWEAFKLRLAGLQNIMKKEKMVYGK